MTRTLAGVSEHIFTRVIQPVESVELVANWIVCFGLHELKSACTDGNGGGVVGSFDC